MEMQMKKEGRQGQMRYNAMQETFEEITVLGKPALVSSIRLHRNTIPKGLYMYEVRHDDEGCGEPVQIANQIMVNHFGTIITREPIQLDVNGYLDIDPEKDWDYSGGGCRTVEEFQGKYPPIRKKEKDKER